jgi:exosortase
MTNHTSPVPSSTKRPISKTTLIKIALLILVLGFLYGKVLIELVGVWFQDDNYSHGFLIPILSGYLVWIRWDRLRQIPEQTCRWGWLIFIGGLLTLTAGIIGAEYFLTRFSLLLVISGILLVCWGWKAFHELFFPLAVLLLMIPIPAIIFNQITFPLQLLASKVAVATLDLFNIPVLREGNIVYLSNSTLEVAEACSGVRSLVSLIAMAIFFSYFSFKGFWLRTLLTLSAIPISIVTNAFRVAWTGMLSYWGDPSMAEGFFHVFTGWAVFIVAFLILLAESFLIKQLLRLKRQPVIAM